VGVELPQPIATESAARAAVACEFPVVAGATPGAPDLPDVKDQLLGTAEAQTMSRLGGFAYGHMKS